MKVVASELKLARTRPWVDLADFAVAASRDLIELASGPLFAGLTMLGWIACSLFESATDWTRVLENEDLTDYERD